MSTRSRDDTSGPAFVAHLLGSPGSRIARFTRLVHGEVLRCVGVLQGHVTEGVPVPAGAPSAVPGALLDDLSVVMLRPARDTGNRLFDTARSGPVTANLYVSGD